MLEVKDLNVKYGEIHAVKGIDLKVEEGGMVALIGANGAGKTSTLSAIMGMVKSSGSVRFLGREIGFLTSWKRAQAGLSIVPERARIFPNMTVKENLEVGAYLLKDKKLIKERFEFVYEIFPRLEERQRQLAMTLSGGEKQMLAIGRALMSRPKLLLIDEISLGLMPKLVDEIFHILTRLNKEGITLLLSEQNTKKALEISTRAYVIQNGKVVKEGAASELLKDPEVKKAYLGV